MDEVLFDTNAFIAWANGDPAISRRMVSIRTPVLSAISIGELALGALNSGRPDENMRLLERRLQDFILVSCDRKAAVSYGEIGVALRRKARPIPQNDIWIAACALQRGCPLLTKDAHFLEVDGLTLIDW